MTELLAPNGKPSNLSPEQWKLVRTPEFKKWFGDWENLVLTKINDSGIDDVSLKRLSDGVSKVVDENGEPLVCYHYSPKDFSVFDKKFHPKIPDLVENKYHRHLGYDFSTKEGFFKKENSFEYKVFLNVRKMFNIENANKSEIEPLIKIMSKIPYYDKNEWALKNHIKYLKEGEWDRLELPSIEKYLSKKYDGLIMYERDWKNIKVYSSENIKLADGMNTKFDGNNPDIRFEEGGYLSNELLEKAREIANKNEYLNCDAFCHRMVDNKLFKEEFEIIPFNLDFEENFESQYNSLIEVLNTGDIIAFGEKDNVRHYAIYLADDDVLEVEMWGGKPRVFSLKNNLYNYENVAFIYRENKFKKGGRTIAQTPAPKKDQIKGSNKNKKGSSKDLKSAKKIELSDKTIEAIKNKVDKHNEKHPNKKITIDSAKAVVRRGMGAYSSSHRPTITGGNPNSRVAWGLARLNAFLYKIVNGKSKSGKYSQDNDLIEELGYKVQKYEIGGIFQGTPYDFNAYSTEYMGTGEGNQVFGWGLYFTDQKAIAERYAYMPNENSFYINGISLKNSNQFTQEEKDIILNIWRDLWQMGYTETSKDYLFEILYELEQKSTLFDEEDESLFDKETILELNEDAKFYNALFDKLKNSDLEIKSNIVNVTLFKGKNPNEYNLLNWYEQPKKEHIELVLKQLEKEKIVVKRDLGKGKENRFKGEALTKIFNNEPTHYTDGTKNSNLYTELSAFLGGDKETSLFLLRAGIYGIKYKSGTLSGISHKEGYNYVIFDADNVTIEGKEKYADGGELKYKNDGAYADVLKISKDEWYLRMIEAEIEGKGYARKIINQIIKDAKNQNVKKITLDSSLYNKDYFDYGYGFEQIYFDEEDDLYRMELKLEDGGDIQAYKDAMGISEFEDGGETKPKKVYVSIELKTEIEGKYPNYFFRFNEKPFEELKNGVLKGLTGVSSSTSNVAEWFSTKDCLIVMDYEKFMASNQTETINYYDAYQLMANKLFLFKRLYGNITRYGEQENVYQQTLTSICPKIRKEIMLEMEISEGQKYRELYRIDRFLDPSITSAFYRWANVKQDIESPIDLTNAILEFNKIDDSYLGDGFENPVLTFDELLPLVELGIVNAGTIWESEQEIILKNRTLVLPKQSQLFFINKDEIGRVRASNQLELVDKYKLKDLYKVYFVDRQDVEKYRTIWKNKYYQEKELQYEKSKYNLELKKDQVVNELFGIFINNSFKSFKEQYEKDYISDLSESRMFYDTESDDYQETYWQGIVLVQFILNEYIAIFQRNWKKFIESKSVENLNLYSFSNLFGEVKYELQEFFDKNKDELEKINNWSEIRGNGYLNLWGIEYLLKKSVDDYENSPEWIDYKEMSKMYLDKMGRELYRYYDKKDLPLISQYKDGGETDELNLLKNTKMENEILVIDMNMYFNNTSVNFKNKEIPLKLNEPKKQYDFIDWAEENNIEFEQWGEFWDAESDVIDTSYGYTFEIPLFKYIEYLKTEKFYTGGELKKGIKTEMEHKDTLSKIKTGKFSVKQGAEMIAKDHLEENDKYYTHLSEMESEFKEGGKVESIHSEKGDIMVSLDDNWYSDDSSVELVPVSELIKFREFDRKVTPKYNQDNSRDNINHLKFMFQKEGVKSPLIIEYSAEDNAVLIIEGNHRLNSAIDLGMEYLPARVVLKKYGKYAPNKMKNAMQVQGIKANEYNYIPSDLKPSQVGIEGAKPIAYADGGIIEGRLHSECGDDGCGRKFQVGENGHIIEAERDEAVIVADAFNDNKEMTIEGTPSEIASALNVIGGGKNFDKGAKIIEDGNEKELPEMKQEATDTDVDDVIDSGSIIINRRSMADEKEYKVTGTPKQIASAINSINGNGVVIEKGAKIE